MKGASLIVVAFAVITGCASTASKDRRPSYLYLDPPRDSAYPAQMVVLHIPTSDVHINGVAYLASGRGPHPTVLLLHGLPGNEKNLDLAQAIRREGWNVVTMNYRGSWGSEGSFRFAHTLEDAGAALAYVRDPANASRLRTDPRRIVVVGHSMGGWVAALTAPHEKPLGVILISAADIGAVDGITRDDLIKVMADNMESLAGTSAAAMADEVLANGKAFSMTAAAVGLTSVPMLVLTSDDGNAPDTDRLIAAIHAAGGTRATHVHVPTDHSWSDSRIRLSVEVVDWLKRHR